ncbi:MAG: hypothetical protein J6A61_05340 [Clostridia bacterium]|nr:hypothetical protein [Clostridia bacterium]
MKKLICLLSILVFMLSLSISVFAGDVPESLLSEDGAKVFIGRVDNVKLKGNISFSSQAEIDTVDVIPTVKIKGEVEIGKKETYTRYDSVLMLEKGKEYLFGYIDENNFYAYEIKSRDEKSIKLVDSDKYDMTKRLEDYLNEGVFARAEQERSTIGNQISFAEFLYKKPSLSSSCVEKVSLRIQDNVCVIDKDKFFELAEDIMVTNVKNDILYETKQNPNSTDAYKTVLYIELLDASDQLVYYGAVSRFGEVDYNALFMSRLMAKDYEMKTEDLSKLYSLLPADVQKGIVAPESLPVSTETLPLELPAVPKKKYIGWVIGGVVVVFLIAFTIGIVIRKKKQR